MIKFLFSLCAATALISVGSAQAAPDEERASVRVAYADLNLGSASGITRLKLRVGRAITELCGESGIREVAELRAVARCRDEAGASIRSQIAIVFANARAQQRARDGADATRTADVAD